MRSCLGIFIPANKHLWNFIVYQVKFNTYQYQNEYNKKIFWCIVRQQLSEGYQTRFQFLIEFHLRHYEMLQLSIHYFLLS